MVFLQFTKNKKGNSDSKKITVHDQLNVYFSFQNNFAKLHFTGTMKILIHKGKSSHFTFYEKLRADHKSRKYPLPSCIRGDSALRSNPLPLYIPFLTEKVAPFCIPSIDKWYPCHIPSLELCIPFNCS